MSTRHKSGRSEKDIPPSHYHGLNYDHLGRFSSYWHQIEEITRGQPANVLEVGVGTGFVQRYLLHNQVAVVTMDINPALRPDVIGDVCSLPFRSDAFDAVLCAEVLEHMPFEDSARALQELARVARDRVVISVPDRTPALRFHLGMSGLFQTEAFLPLPGLTCPWKLLGADHEWELGMAGYPVRRLVQVSRRAGLALTRTFRVLHNPSSRVFVLRKVPV